MKSNSCACSARRAKMLRAADMKFITFCGRRYSVRINGFRLGLFQNRESARQARDRFLKLFQPKRKAA